MPQASNLLSFVPVSNPEPRPNSADGSRPRPVVVETEEETALRKITEAALTATGASGAALALRRGGAVVCLARAGEMSPPLGARLDDRSGISGECLREGEPIRCDDTENDARVDAEACRSLGLRSLAIAALRQIEGTNSTIVGILEVFSPDAGTFTDKHLDVLQQLAELAVEGLGSSVTEVPIQDHHVPDHYVPDRDVHDHHEAPVAQVSVSHPPELSPALAPPEPAMSASLPTFTPPLRSSASTATPLPGDVNIAAYMAAHEKSKAKIDPRITKIVLIGLAAVLVGALLGRYLDRMYSTRNVASAPAPPVTAASVAALAPPPVDANSNATTKPSSESSNVSKESRNSKAMRDSLTNAASLDRISTPASRRSAPPLAVVQHDSTVAAESDVAPSLPLGNSDNKASENVASILSAPAALPQKAPPISQGVEGGELETKVAAIYPPQARSVGVQGQVVMDALIAEDGSVRDVKVVSGPPMLRQAAVDAVRRWKYKPYKLNGKAIPAQTQVTLDFKPR